MPTALRAAALIVLTMTDVYGPAAAERVQDPEWLQRAGQEGWAVLMKDQRIQRRPAERAALIASGVRPSVFRAGT